MYQRIDSEELCNCNQIIENFRNSHFKHIKEVYLDHAGATVYSELQISKFTKDLLCNTYGNPHSNNDAGKRTFKVVEEVRRKTLEYFNTSSQEYSVIFVQNSTAALNLIASCFKFDGSQDLDPTEEYGAENAVFSKETTQPNISQSNQSSCRKGILAYLDDSHTSVVGMRIPVRSKGARVLCRSREDIESELKAQDSKVSKELSQSDSMKRNPNNLFAYPAQSNFSGERYPLSWIKEIKERKTFLGSENGWCVLLDAASLLTTTTLDLSLFQPDFIVFSFYKIFGFPTGLGCLLVKNSSHHMLEKIYFGGGTINLLLPNDNVEVFRSDFSERFEDGTLPYLEILAVKHGFESFQELIGPPIDVSRHTFALASHTYDELKKLKYANEQVVVELYHSNEFESQEIQGPIINFNVLKVDGCHVGCSRVNEMAKLHGICLRSGCFCNIGACQRYLNISSRQLIDNYHMGHICGDGVDIIDGRPTGSVRISYGFSSTFSDVESFLNFIRTCFLERGNISLTEKVCNISNLCRMGYRLQEIWIYPIKSCSGIKVDRCQIDIRGLKNDRKWVLLNSYGKAITQKDAATLCCIKCQLRDSILRVHCKGFDGILITDGCLNSESSIARTCIGKVCGDKISMEKYEEKVNEWFAKVLKISDVCLMKQNDSDERMSRNTEINALLSLTNEAQFLLIGSSSLETLFEKMRAGKSLSFNLEELSKRFRANFLARTNTPFEEETWDEIKIGNETFKKVGLCNRCKMICIDQETGIASREPLLTLMNFPKRRTHFGILLVHIRGAGGSKPEIFVGDSITILEYDHEFTSK